MKDELTENQTTAILNALDTAIETGPWDESNFLRVIGKNLRTLRDDFAEHLSGEKQHKAKVEAHLATQTAQRTGQQEVFVALYSSDGDNMQSWERIIANLPRQMISRPIYPDEEAVKSLIKAKENKSNEAYVAIYINQSDILVMSEEKTPLDKLGKPLLSLKDRALNLENITRFVHMTNTYTYIKGRLIKNSETN